MKRFLRAWYHHALRFWDRLYSWDDGMRNERGRPVLAWSRRERSTYKKPRPYYPAVEALEPRRLMATVQFNPVSYVVGEGAGTIDLTVELDQASSSTITVDYATLSGIASAGEDYTETSGTVTFAPNQTSRPITISITDDSKDEPNEYFTVSLSNPTGASLGTDWQADVDITDNDPAPTVQFTSSSSSQPEHGLDPVGITVTLSAASAFTVEVPYTTSGTATIDVDYYVYPDFPKILVFSPGQTSGQIDPTVIDDWIDEDDETAILTLGTPTNATLGTIYQHTHTITDDDDPPMLSFETTEYTVAEDGTSATITVNLSAASGKTVTVQYATSNDTAFSGSDYTSASGTLTFVPDDISETFTVLLVNDTDPEPDEVLNLTLSNPSNATLDPGLATLTIFDDDAASHGGPVDFYEPGITGEVSPGTGNIHLEEDLETFL